ncbi:MAG: hypothetical protein ACON4U_08620 [Myxococcota bacterium]
MLMFLSLLACQSCQENQLVQNDKIQNDTGLEDAGFTNDWGSWLAMEILSDGTPVIGYYDKTEGGLGVAKLAGTNWNHQEVDGYKDEQGLDQGDRGKYIDMVVDSADNIWLSYYDINLKNLRYAYYDSANDSWTNDIADTGGGGSPDAGLFSSITLDGNGSPVIAHYDANRGDLRVASWTGSGFEGTVVDEGEDAVDSEGASVDANTGQFTDIVADGNTLYVSFYDAAAGDLRLATNTGEGWSIETIDSEGDVGQWSTLTIENGTIHVAYHDVSNQDLKYAVGSPGSFSIETVDDGAYVGADTDITVIGTQIHIAYFDGQNNDMKLATLSDGAWSTQTLGVDGEAVGFHNELEIRNGSPYLGCYNYTLKSAWFTTP